jgi:hypothetical protein
VEQSETRVCSSVYALPLHIAYCSTVVILLGIKGILHRDHQASCVGPPWDLESAPGSRHWYYFMHGPAILVLSANHRTYTVFPAGWSLSVQCLLPATWMILWTMRSNFKTRWRAYQQCAGFFMMLLASTCALS